MTGPQTDRLTETMYDVGVVLTFHHGAIGGKADVDMTSPRQ